MEASKIIKLVCACFVIVTIFLNFDIVYACEVSAISAKISQSGFSAKDVRKYFVRGIAAITLDTRLSDIGVFSIPVLKALHQDGLDSVRDMRIFTRREILQKYSGLGKAMLARFEGKVAECREFSFREERLTMDDGIDMLPLSIDHVQALYREGLGTIGLLYAYLSQTLGDTAKVELLQGIQGIGLSGAIGIIAKLKAGGITFAESSEEMSVERLPSLKHERAALYTLHACGIHTIGHMLDCPFERFGRMGARVEELFDALYNDIYLMGFDWNRNGRSEYAPPIGLLCSA